MKLTQKNIKKIQREMDKYNPEAELENFAANHEKVFWRAEYIKRKYFHDRLQSGTVDFQETLEFKFISKWRERREEKIRNGKSQERWCTELECPYSTAKHIKIDNLPQPFFYNTTCKRCEFKLHMTGSVIELHNEKHPEYNTYINDIRFQIPSIHKWSDEFRAGVNILHEISYRYGLLAHELFALTSPAEIIKAKFKIPLLHIPELFLRKNNKETDYELIKILRKDPNINTLCREEIDNLITEYEIVVSIDLNVNNFTSKKAIIECWKTIEDYQKKHKNPQKGDRLCTHHILFGLNPSHDNFSKKKIVPIMRSALDSYIHTQYSLGLQLAISQQELTQKDKIINNVPAYRETNESRTVGLYLWDQIHLLKKEPADAINDFLNSKLYETNLLPNEVKTRATQKEQLIRDKKNIKLGTTREYRNAYRNYQYAHICIKNGKLLTGAKCQEKISPSKN
ncbi:hypothetical protein [Maridesulfovibrio sp.]|uniref:hypothetical protein n=1 Tax=Maridesulfovibrio sp. TaxID=2795000 RepID=UPI0029C9E4B0|nr:hypothetical protein [Maridesulfovibrio sp.]